MELGRFTAAQLCAKDPVQLANVLGVVHQYQHDIRSRTKAEPSSSELTSWRTSLVDLAARLVAAGLANAEVLIEYVIPYYRADGNSISVDAVVCGPRGYHQSPSYVFVELKLWDEVHPDQDDPEKCIVPPLGNKRKTHPAVEVARSLELAQRHVLVLADRETQVSALVYMQSVSQLEAQWLTVLATVPKSEVFMADQKSELELRFRGLIDRESGAGAADRLLMSSATPDRRKLADIAVRGVERLTPQQADAIELVRETAMKGGGLVLIEGGPGTGKSVVAVELLRQLTSEGLNVVLATQITTYRKHVKHLVDQAGSALSERVISFADLVHMTEPLDVIICDEAHRLPDWPWIDKTAEYKQENPGHRTVELLKAKSKTRVLMFDRNQAVRADEFDRRTLLSRVSRSGEKRSDASLDGMAWRAGGTGRYEAWVDRLLLPAKGGVLPWIGEARYELHVADDPVEMETWVADHREAYPRDSARVVAGFCWKWAAKPVSKGVLVEDVKIGDWWRPWNARKPTGGIPGREDWPTDPRGVDQIGCVHTCQGFEFDWTGVIIGRDLVWRGDRWEGRPEENKDTGAKRGLPPKGDPGREGQFRTLAANTYRILLTRGLRGTVIYAQDEETRAFLKRIVAWDGSVAFREVLREHADQFSR